MTDQAPSESLRIDVSTAVDHPSWDSYLASAPGGHHLQTSSWAQVKSVAGWTAVRAIARRGARIVGGGQMLLSAVGMGRAIAYVPKGPLSNGDDPEVAGRLLDCLVGMAAERRALFLSIQPPNSFDGAVPLLRRRRFEPAATDVAPSATVLIDLASDDLLGRMKKNHRRYVRHAGRQGVTTRIGTESDLATFYALLSATARRQGFTPYPLDYYRTMWRVLRPGGHIGLLLADYHDEPVSAQIIIPFGDTVIAKTSGWSGRYGDLGPNHALEWASMSWAKENGYRWYDLEGIDRGAAELLAAGRPIPAHMRSSPFFHKLGFGGTVALYPRAYMRIPNPLLRWGATSVLPRVLGRPSTQRLLQAVRKGRPR